MWIKDVNKTIYSSNRWEEKLFDVNWPLLHRKPSLRTFVQNFVSLLDNVICVIYKVRTKKNTTNLPIVYIMYLICKQTPIYFSVYLISISFLFCVSCEKQTNNSIQTNKLRNALYWTLSYCKLLKRFRFCSRNKSKNASSPFIFLDSKSKPKPNKNKLKAQSLSNNGTIPLYDTIELNESEATRTVFIVAQLGVSECI